MTGPGAGEGPPEGPSRPEPWSYVVDARSGRVGQVMAYEAGYVQLRPPGGGREWDCPPAAVRPVPEGEVLRARVREVNRQGRLP